MKLMWNSKKLESNNFLFVSDKIFIHPRKKANNFVDNYKT